MGLSRKVNIGLFAADVVGYKISKFLSDIEYPLSCLVLDSQDNQNLNNEILKYSNIYNSNAIFYSDSLYDLNTLKQLKELNLDVGILAWWPYILKGDLLEIPKIGYLNFHPSYLPYNRGKDPNFWSLVEDVPFGVTLQFIDSGIDSGDITFQRQIEKTWEDTGQTLYEKAREEIVELFKENFYLIKEGRIHRQKQNLNSGSFHKRSELDAASEIKLDAFYKARDLLNLIRARTFPPHPAAWFREDGVKYEVRIDIRRVDEE